MATVGDTGNYVEVQVAQTAPGIIGGQTEADKVVYADIENMATQYAVVDPGPATSAGVIGAATEHDIANRVLYADINPDPDAVPLPPSRPGRPVTDATDVRDAPAGSTPTLPPAPRAGTPELGPIGASGDGGDREAAAATSTVEAAAMPGRRLFQLYSGCKAEIIGRELVPTDPAAKWSADDEARPANGLGSGGGTGHGGGGGKKHTRRTHFILYTIKITSRFQPEKYDAWQIKRRYSDFHQLHKDLSKATDNAKVLQLAPKRFVKNNLAEEFLNKRQSLLNLYLDALLGVGVLVKHPLTLKFMDA